MCASISSCSDDDPRFGDPSSIKGKTLPDSPVLDFFPTPYDAEKPTPAGAVARHKAVNQVVPTRDLSCMGCHGPPGPDTPQVGAVQALFAGWIGGRLTGEPAKKADVVVIDEDKNRFETKTDDDGFFWIASDGKPARQLFVGVRDSAVNQVRMSPGFSVGNCTASNCHGASTPAGYALLP